MGHQLFLPRQHPSQVKPACSNLRITDCRDQVLLTTNDQLAVLLHDIGHQQAGQGQAALLRKRLQAGGDLFQAVVELLESNNLDLADPEVMAGAWRS